MMPQAPVTKKRAWLAAIPVVPILLAILYLAVRTALFFMAEYAWYEKVVAGGLLFAEMFMFVHGVGYLGEIFHVIVHGGTLQGDDGTTKKMESHPAVAVVVSAYHEPIDVLEKTLSCLYNLNYPKICVYFLDDTRYDLPGSDPVEMEDYRNAVDSLCQRHGAYLFRRTWHGAKAGMINDFIGFMGAMFLDGYEFYNYGRSDCLGEETYIAIFDADQNPMPGFLDPLIARLEEQKDLAFVQTPQYYTNFRKNRVARSAGLQQVIFHEYICEGKNLKESMFCCGTGVVFRIAALQEVGGLDTTSVTEDFATSLKLHQKKWRSAYHRRVMAFGMGPEDLGAYFKQQFRWALGTIGMLRRMVPLFFSKPRSMPALRWWEYFLSGSYYMVGWVHFIFMLCPMLYLFWGVPTYFAHPEIYLLFFLPYLTVTLSVFMWTLQQRGYRFWDIMQGQLLAVLSFPVYMKASLLGLLGVRGRFVVTPKGKSNQLPLRELWPQLGLAFAELAAGVWGVHRMIYEGGFNGALGVNVFWAFGFFALMSGILYFNNPQDTSS